MILEVEPKEILLIKQGLMELPFKQVYELLSKVEQQIVAQIQQPVPAVKKEKDGE